MTINRANGRSLYALKLAAVLSVFQLGTTTQAATWYTMAGGVKYAFEVQKSTSNYWNPETEGAPKLPPKAALDVASEFVRDIPARFDSVWVAKEVSLSRVGQELDQWAYLVTFWPGPKPEVKNWGGSFASFQVIVTLDGRIAKVTTAKYVDGKRPEPAANPAYLAATSSNASHASLIAYPNAIISTRDKETGITAYVESDGRHLAVFSGEGALLWNIEIIKQNLACVGTPVIRNISFTKDKLSVVFCKHSFGEVDLKSGAYAGRGSD